MNESKLAHLFLAYINKTATTYERDELMELVAQSENDERLETLLTDTWQQFNSHRQLYTDKQGDEMIARILQKGSVNKPAPLIPTFRSSITWLRIAAAATVVFFAVTGVYFWLNPKQSGLNTAQLQKISKGSGEVIMQGGNRAVLTLADGSNIVLDSSKPGTLTKQGNAKVTKLNSATLAYKAGDGNSPEIVYNTLSTPRGGQYQLILPDGTKVWLNASSSIYFPTVFKGKDRKVTVTGEAYFEVAKIASIPFKINVKDMEVQVLGTHFNIMAYNEENSMNTTLLEGSVKVSRGLVNTILAPGQESRISLTDDIKIVEADIEEVMAWKNGWFQFNGYDIEKVMRQVSRWYDIEIVYEGKIPSGHFTGLVSRQNEIAQVLKIMQAGGVHFRIEGRKVFVYS